MALRQPRPRLVLSLTPLIDVVFILLIFFMLVSQFSDWRKIELMPQTALAQGTNHEEASSLHLLNDGTFMLDGVAFQEVRDVVARLTPSANDEAIFLSPEDAVEIQRVVDAIEALRDAGLTNFQLVEMRGHVSP